jgi:hypothetical protein
VVLQEDDATIAAIEGVDRRWTTPELSARYLNAVKRVLDKKEGQDLYRTKFRISPGHVHSQAKTRSSG